ncbi:MAG: hypothetical protein Q6363_007820 [Candidatus Njordarchaeota archaeon]
MKKVYIVVGVIVALLIGYFVVLPFFVFQEGYHVEVSNEQLKMNISFSSNIDVSPQRLSSWYIGEKKVDEIRLRFHIEIASPLLASIRDVMVSSEAIIYIINNTRIF